MSRHTILYQTSHT